VAENVKVLSETVLAKQWGTLSRAEIELQRRDGTWQAQAREVYDHGNAAAVLLCNPDSGMVVLTRQFRYPVHRNGDPAWLLEACAGLLDGDTPEDCARRESEEETGYRPHRLAFAFAAYASPGSLTEKLYGFIGYYDETARVSAGGGLDHEGEDIEVLEMPFATAMAMLANGEIGDAKTVMLLQHAALTGVFAGRQT